MAFRNQIFMFLILSVALSAPIAITPQTTFIDAIHCDDYSEDYDIDNGGNLYVFVKNTGTEPDRISDVRINGSSANYTWYRFFPEELGSAGSPTSFATVIVKGTDAPLAEGESITIEVYSENGGYDGQSRTLSSPDLRIGNAIASQDMTMLNIFVRNDDSLWRRITGIKINERSYTPGSSPELSVVGGSYDIPPNSVLILKVDWGYAMEYLMSLALRIQSERLDGSNSRWTGSGIRLIEPRFVIGNWSSSLPEEEDGMAYAKKLQLDFNNGPGNWAFMNDMWDRYHIYSSIQLSAPIDPVQIENQRHNDGLLFWYVKDEPDLHEHPSPDILERAETYHTNDPEHPTYLNLCVSRCYSEFGNQTDIIGMDHYAAFSAPNIIELTWGLRYADLREAFDYTEVLKWNTEPRPMWVWVQLASGVWDTQPLAWTVDYQYWAHIMSGSKGYLWFKYGAGYESDSDYENAIEEAEELTRQLSGVKNLCLMGEPLDNITRSTSDIYCRSLVGEDAMVIVVLNDSYTMSGPWFYPVYLQYEIDYTITAPLPGWISTANVYRVTPDGRDFSVPHTISGGNITIGAVDIHYDSHVYVITDGDTEPPKPPERAHFAQLSDLNTYTLTWKEPWDNFGVERYRLYRDGIEFAETRHPIFQTTTGPSVAGDFSIRAEDAAGNLSLPKQISYGMTRFDDSDNLGRNRGYLERWDMTNQIAAYNVEDGALTLHIGGSDPYIISPILYLPTSTYRYFRLRMRNNTTSTLARLFWVTATDPVWNAEKSAFMTIETDSDMHDYYLHMDDYPTWSGTVTQLRLDPIDDGVTSSGTVELDMLGVQWFMPLDVIGDGNALPEKARITIHPNPFNSALRITAPENANVTIHDTQGRIVADLGKKRIWQAEDDVASGVYIVRAVVGDVVVDGKAVLIR